MNNVKQLSSLIMFAEVVRKQSFTLAAKHLGMSKSAISQQIKRLEQDIGQQLLSRHTRGMSLTTAGERLLQRCELLKDQVDLAFKELSQNKETPSGKFSITIPHACEKDIVIPALNQLCKEFPGIIPEVLVSDSAKDLIEHDLDVAIYGGTLKDSSYRALPIGSSNEMMCASPHYVQQKGQLTTIDDIHAHRVILSSWQNGTLALSKQKRSKQTKSAQAITIPITDFAKTNTLHSALEMALHGMGIVLLPEFVTQAYLTRSELVRVLPDYQGQQWPFYLVHRFHGEKPIHVTRFHQLVKCFFNKVNVSL